MYYLVPAWHTRLGDWAYGTPNLNFDDIVSLQELLSFNKEGYGLVITDYLPQLSTRLANISLAPKKLFSVFDYIQDITQMDNSSLNYEDFDWPSNALMELDPFRIIVRNDAKIYAKIIFDMESKINWVEFFDDNEQHVKTLLMDSRGFVSRVEYFNQNNQMSRVQFLNQLGEWRIQYFPANDSVEVNPLFENDFAQNRYDHINDLITEVVNKRFIQQLKPQDRLIVTVDDDARVPLALYQPLPTIFLASKWHSFENGLRQLPNLPRRQLVVDTPFTAQKVKKIMNYDQSPTDIPLYRAMFKLGHSQQIKGQKIYLFIDKLEQQQLESLVTIIVNQLMDHPDRDQLCLLSYGGNREMADRLISMVVARQKGRFVVQGHEPETTKENIDLYAIRKKVKKEPLPVLKIEYVEYGDISTLMKALDKARLLIDWGDHPDDLLQMVAVSVGIPSLQRVQTPEIQDRKNGWICRDLIDLRDGLSYYLDDINHWNASLANDVQILNQYSADQLSQMWAAVWQANHDGGREE